MKRLWNFGGTHTEFGQKISEGFDKIQFGRDNVDYSDVEYFLQKIESNPSDYPVPDIIVFNMNPNTHYIDLDKKFTPKSDIDTLTKIINTNFYFQVRLVEWFFSNFSNKRVLFLTSQESNCIVRENEPLNSDTFKDGDLLLYRMNRALEHQLIHTQNVLKKNHINNNIIMGVCVGYNVPGTANYINYLLHSDIFKRNVFSLGMNTIKTGITYYTEMVSSKKFPSLS